MARRHRRTIAAGAAALVAVVGGGAAIAATNGSTPQQESKAIVDDAAGQLGISSTELSNALKKALQNRVDEAVEAGRLTEAQGTSLKERIAAGEVPLVGVGPGGRGGHGGPHGHGMASLDAAASFLGITETQLRSSLESGDSLADVAKAKGKSVDGLIAALVASAKERIAADVAAGRLTEAQEQDILSGLEQRVTDMVNGVRPEPPAGSGFRGGPPAFEAPAALGAAA